MNTSKKMSTAYFAMLLLIGSVVLGMAFWPSEMILSLLVYFTRAVLVGVGVVCVVPSLLILVKRTIG